MDDDTARLVIELSTHAGMLMEDASVQALTLRMIAPAERGLVLHKLVGVSEQIGFLLNGAIVLQS